MKFADPTNDIAFKKIFGNENKTEILISFLNAILDFEGNDRIKSISIANPYQIPKIEDLKNTILDIRAIDNNNNSFIVEMQVEKDKDFTKRSLYYTSKAYVSQIDKAQNYKLLQKVYFIGILNFSIFHNSDYISRHLILDKKTFKQELGDFDFTFIELSKFNKDISSLNTISDKWIYFIKNASSFELVPDQFQDIKEFSDAFDIAHRYKWTKEEDDIYDYVSMNEGLRENSITTAREEGKDEGLAIGKLEGEKVGIEKGKLEGGKQAKIEIAKNLIDILDIETIALKTGLSIEDLEKLL